MASWISAWTALWLERFFRLRNDCCGVEWDKGNSSLCFRMMVKSRLRRLIVDRHAAFNINLELHLQVFNFSNINNILSNPLCRLRSSTFLQMYWTCHFSIHFLWSPSPFR